MYCFERQRRLLHLSSPEEDAQCPYAARFLGWNIFSCIMCRRAMSHPKSVVHTFVRGTSNEVQLRFIMCFLRLATTSLRIAAAKAPSGSSVMVYASWEAQREA